LPERIKLFFEFDKSIFLYGLSDVSHEIYKKANIMNGIQPIHQKLPGQIKVPQISPAVIAAGIATATFIHRAGVEFKT